MRSAEAGRFEPAGKFHVAVERKYAAVPGENPLHCNERGVIKPASDGGAREFGAPGVDEVGLDFFQFAREEHCVQPVERSGTKPRRGSQTMKGGVPARKGVGLPELAAQDDDVQFEIWPDREFVEQHTLPRGGMETREPLQLRWKVREPFDREIGKPRHLERAVRFQERSSGWCSGTLAQRIQMPNPRRQRQERKRRKWIESNWSLPSSFSDEMRRGSRISTKPSSSATTMLRFVSMMESLYGTGNSRPSEVRMTNGLNSWSILRWISSRCMVKNWLPRTVRQDWRLARVRFRNTGSVRVARGSAELFRRDWVVTCIRQRSAAASRHRSSQLGIAAG